MTMTDNDHPQNGSPQTPQEIKAAVEDRIRKQSTPPDNNHEISAKFVRECLFANELGDGTLYAAIHKGRFIFSKAAKEWFMWAGHFWQMDIMERANIAVEDCAQRYLQEAHDIVDQIDAATKKGDSDKIKKLKDRQGMIYTRVARLRSDRGRNHCLNFAHRNHSVSLAIEGNELDQRPLLLPCQNGVLNLQTGELRPGIPEDYMSKASPATWQGINAPCPIWEKTISEIFNGDMDLVDYMQRLFGYSATGLTVENILPIMYGRGRNGKTTIVETISDVLGPLARPIQSELLLDQGRMRSSSGPSPDIMALRGIRLVFGSEADEGRRFSPSKVKLLSGGDTLVGRFPHDRYESEFKPTHTLFLLTNHKPSAPPGDFAFWQRVHLIPFTLSFVDYTPQHDFERPADKYLKAKLADEASGILAWIVRGALQWQQVGIRPPDIIRTATDEYRREEDVLQDFLDQCCLQDPAEKVNASVIYDAFKEWFSENVSKKYMISQKKFGEMMTERFQKKKAGTYQYFGLRLLSSLD